MARISDLVAAVENLTAAVSELLARQAGQGNGTFLTSEDQTALDEAVSALQSQTATVTNAAAQVPPPPTPGAAGT